MNFKVCIKNHMCYCVINSMTIKLEDFDIDNI